MVCPQRLGRSVLSPLLLLLFSHRASPAAAQNCTKCLGGGQTCCGKYNQCCNGGGSGWSCIATDETCCAGTACIKQTTYCCPQTTDPSCPNGKCPARCCPRWTVCCSKGGRDGCCHPLEAAFESVLGGHDMPTHSPTSHGTTPSPSTAAGPSVFAMFLEAGAFAEPLKVLTIDTSTGHQTSKVVKGYDTHGENTRLFEFNRAAGMFVTFEQDYSQAPSGPTGAQQLLPMYMYSISPADGAVTKSKVTLAPDINHRTRSTLPTTVSLQNIPVNLTAICHKICCSKLLMAAATNTVGGWDRDHAQRYFCFCKGRGVALPYRLQIRYLQP